MNIDLSDDLNNLIDYVCSTIEDILNLDIDSNLRHILMQLYHVCDAIKYTDDNLYWIALEDLSVEFNIYVKQMIEDDELENQLELLMLQMNELRLAKM